MALADMLEKIVKDAEKQAEEIKAFAKGEVEKIEAQNSAYLKTQAKDLAEVYAQEKAEIEKQALLQAKMEARTENLKQKRAIIEKTLEAVKEALENISETDYQKLLKGLLKEIAQEFKEAEITPATGRESATKKALADYPNLKLAKTVGKFKGGFIAKTQTAEVDSTFENLIFHIYRGQLELIISQELFA